MIFLVKHLQIGKMRKKQTITKDEAIILLQSQPLSASLWQLASDRLKDNAIRFPDPSYLDSQTWPDYHNKKHKNSLKSHANSESQVAVNSAAKLEDNQPVEQTVSIPEKTENLVDANSNYNQMEVIQEIIAIEIIETTFPEKQKKSVVKKHAKKSVEENTEESISSNIEAEHQDSLADIVVSSTPSSKPLDFYEWLEELREPNDDKVIKPKIRKSKAKLTKEAQEIANAKTAAENSLKLGEEIVSETLARLLARQGHKEEAIEMYQKLIVKYPEKGATFAAALEKLKS
jgi:hypothetical protein